MPGEVRRLWRDHPLAAERSLAVFCRCVAVTYRIHQTKGYPADRKYLRHFLAVRSATYFYRVSHKLDAALTDPDLKRSNAANRDRWRRLTGIALLGAEAQHVGRLIETLELQRLLIEHAFDRSAFRWSRRAAEVDGRTEAV